LEKPSRKAIRMHPPPNSDATETSRLQISGHQVELGDALRGYVTDQLTELATKYFGGVEDMACTFSRTGIGGFAVSLRVHSGPGMYFDGRGEAQEPIPAFNIALEHVAKQLRRRKRELREDKPVNPDKAGPP
jgi:ribosomal subunit interface protein